MERNSRSEGPQKEPPAFSPLSTLVLIDSLPDMILPGLASVASKRTYVQRIAVETLVTYCGPVFLERRKRSRELLARYLKGAGLSGV
jgi:hypothetical protein